jgi:hypothetical protein
VIRHKHHFPRSVVIQMWECNFILSPDRLANYDFRDIIELVPVLILLVDVSVQWLEFRAAWDGNVQSLSREEALQIEEIIVVFIDDI